MSAHNPSTLFQILPQLNKPTSSYNKELPPPTSACNLSQTLLCMLVWQGSEGKCSMSMVVSDGPFKDKQGTAAWMLYDSWQLLTSLAFQWTHMSPWEAGTLYHSCFVPALSYPLPASWLPDQFFDKVHHLFTWTILNKMGYHQDLPQCLVFAPWCSIGGIGLCNLCYKMEAQQLIILLHHMCTGTPLGNTIEILTRMYQLWAVLENAILVNTCPCPWVPDRWLSHLQCTMQTHNIKIIYQAWTFKPLQNKDVRIMETLADARMTNDQLEQLNACHMYLQVTILAKITDHTGTHLLPHAFSNSNNSHPQGLLTISHSLLSWPTVHNPSPSLLVQYCLIPVQSVPGTLLVDYRGPSTMCMSLDLVQTPSTVWYYTR